MRCGIQAGDDQAGHLPTANLLEDNITTRAVRPIPSGLTSAQALNPKSTLAGRPKSQRRLSPSNRRRIKEPLHRPHTPGQSAQSFERKRAKSTLALSGGSPEVPWAAPWRLAPSCARAHPAGFRAQAYTHISIKPCTYKRSTETHTRTGLTYSMSHTESQLQRSREAPMSIKMPTLSM